MFSPYAPWSIWLALPMLLKLFFLLLSVVAVYTLFSAFTMMAHLRSLMKQQTTRDILPLEHSLAILRDRSSNLRQLLSLFFYFFGFVFFLKLPLATMVILDSNLPIFFPVLHGFLIYFAFAANVFSVFIVLHCLQWFVSRRINACALQLRVLYARGHS
jgi:hypothetical protein